MAEKTFRAKTQAEAEALADEWLNANPQVANPKRLSMITRSGLQPHAPKGEGARWHVTIFYDD